MSTSEIAGAVGGEVFGRETTVDGVTIDSRRVTSGDLFVPVVADRDGHSFIGPAIAAGAVAYLTSGPIEAATAVRVPDTARALLDLGRHARRRLPDRVVGITGSVGKTSTKDLLAAVLRTTYSTAASEGSFNNELGVPLTLCNATEGTGASVIEMGARGPGHIALLCSVARPTIGVVTVVAEAHLEQFGTLDDVATAKGELVEALPADGWAVLNAEDPRVAAMGGRTPAQVLTYGRSIGTVRAEGIEIDDQLRAAFRLVTPWGATDVVLAVHGAHQVVNALAAGSAALVAGVDLDDVAKGLAAGELSAMRMQLRRAPSGALVLNDTYNANPASMRAALESLARLPAARRTAILGTMAELGPMSESEHVLIASFARSIGVRLVAVGEPAYSAAAEDSAATIDEAMERLGALDAGDVVLIKGSRVAGLDRLADRLVPPGG